MKRLFACLISSLGELDTNNQIENINSKAKIITFDESRVDVTLTALIKEKFKLTSLGDVKKVCLKNGVTIETLNELKDDDFVYAITNSGDQSIGATIKDEWITLNVGGRIFNTTRTTLIREPDSFFGRMFSLEYQDWTHRTKKDAITIDRSSRYFETILGYLRYYLKSKKCFLNSII